MTTRSEVIALEIGSTGNGRNPIFNGRRQPSCGGTSRMTRGGRLRCSAHAHDDEAHACRLPQRDAIGAKRTFRERRERVDLTNPRWIVPRSHERRTNHLPRQQQRNRGGGLGDRPRSLRAMSSIGPRHTDRIAAARRTVVEPLA
jgi:hypothetical protein